jgi:ABC-type branched-subunit amino acid transport system substrate-binding protein
VLKPAAFEPDDVKDSMLSAIRKSGFRIVFVLANEDDVHTLASLARRESMTTGWAWLVSEERTAVPAMAGWLSFRPCLASDMQAFAKQVSDYSKSHFDITVRPESVNLAYSVALYDAIMLYAHAATKVLSEGGDLHDGVAVTKAMQNVTFTGVGGSPVALDSKGDRIESYEVVNYVREVGDVLSRVAVGVFSATLKKYQAYGREVVWPGSSTLLPLDYVPGDDEYCNLSHFCISIYMSAVVACSDLAMRIGLRRAVF